MPAVSVIIPAYNSARFLAETIQSVLAQSLQDFELIIVDDGSTDNTRDILAGFSDARIKYFFQSNRGAPAARNYGLKQSAANYVYFLDADDVLFPNTLAKSVSALKSCPEAGFSYGQAAIMEENGHIYRIRKSSIQNSSGIVEGNRQIRELLGLPMLMITTSSVMARRACLDEIKGFNEEMTSISEDGHLFIRLAKKYPVFYIAEPLVKYRVHTNQLHKRVDPVKAEMCFLMVLAEIYDDPLLAPQFQRWKGAFYGYAYLTSASYAYGHDMALARNYIIRGLKSYPRVILQRKGMTMLYKYLVSFLPIRLWSILRDFKWRMKGFSLSAQE